MHAHHRHYYHRSHVHHYNRHRYYGSGFHLSFHFGYGSYVGFRYYYPYRHYISGLDYAFFYSAPVSYTYVPYGFYCDSEPLYVSRRPYVVTEEVPEYETVESEEIEDGGEVEVEPAPATATPTAERFLRDASTAFGKADYTEAAEKFRLAAVAAPEHAGPLFAFAQALLALGKDKYAARVMRRAINMNADLVREPGDIVGVYKDQAEFDRILAQLEARAAGSDETSDERFLLAAQRFFSGDPRALPELEELWKQLPGDVAVDRLYDAARKRFEKAESLPPIK